MLDLDIVMVVDLDIADLLSVVAVAAEVDKVAVVEMVAAAAEMVAAEVAAVEMVVHCHRPEPNKRGQKPN